MYDDGQILRKQQSCRDEFPASSTYPVYVIVPVLIAVRNRLPASRSGSFLAGGTHEAQRANKAPARSLAGMSPQRHRDIRQPHATERVSVLICGGHLDHGERGVVGMMV